MQVHLLITPEMEATMPTTAKVIFSTPITMVTFKPRGGVSGLNSIVEDTKENIIAWLKPFDGIWVGDGVPQLEQFEIMHISDDL